MHYTIGLIAAAALAATPAMAQDNVAATIPDAGNAVNTTDAVTVDPAMNGVAVDPAMNGMPVPVEQTAAVPVETAPTRPARKESFPWGILGLLGLVGLLGHFRK